MKKFYLLFIILLLTSCSSIGPIISNNKILIAYELGRITTVSFLYEKNKISKEKQDLIIKIWLSFDYCIKRIDQNNIFFLRMLIKKQLKKYIQNPLKYSLACKLTDMYFDKLNQKFNFKKYTKTQIYLIIKNYHDGIVSAIQDYAK